MKKNVIMALNNMISFKTQLDIKIILLYLSVILELLYKK